MKNTTHVVIIKQGWVMAGEWTPWSQQRWDETKGQLYILENAACVQKWGTTRGIGQLALSGITSETVLAPCGRVELNYSNVLMVIPCIEKDWTVVKSE